MSSHSYQRIPDDSTPFYRNSDFASNRRPFSSSGAANASIGSNGVNSSFSEYMDNAYSDSEAAPNYANRGALMSTSLPIASSLNFGNFQGADEYVDNPYARGFSAYDDEFGENNNVPPSGKAMPSVVRTGRQRKKQAARSKGGEFQARRKKRRVYFCCISSEIDIQKVYDNILGSSGYFGGWKCKLYNDVLHLYKAGNFGEDSATGFNGAPAARDRYEAENMETASTPRLHMLDSLMVTRQKSLSVDLGTDGEGDDQKASAMDKYSISGSPRGMINASKSVDEDIWRISLPRAQEVFVFDFGAVVFWGFSRGEETNMMNFIKKFVNKEHVSENEFHAGEDDMAFVTSPDATISIANDVITLADDTPPKQRLSISFAIAQSSVLAIFESRIEKKVKDYKDIPVDLATYGKVKLSERELGQMIGAVFVIRHDVNLHSEILDTPDFFWKQEHFEQDYKMVMNYLEMGARTEVLNKRLDMLRELLNVLQQQMETAHAVKLEWIVIWLIVIEVILQLLAVGGESLGWYKHR